MIPLAVTARNEEQTIGACLQSLLAAVEYAEACLPLTFDVMVVLDDCTDGTGDVARSFPRVRCVESHGGLIEAQRTVVQLSSPEALFVVFSDADILIERPSLAAVCRVLLEDPTVRVSYASKKPLPPRGKGLLTRALYSYNRDRSFLTRRSYFIGRFFAIRSWNIPTVEELAHRVRQLPPDRFYVFERGVIVDDIYLSRRLLWEFGPEVIREAPGSLIWFRPSETFTGMYRTYKRIRWEAERLDRLFPETRASHRRDGIRRNDWNQFSRASTSERWLWRVFHAALVVCALRYEVERFFYQNLAWSRPNSWDTVVESKWPLPSLPVQAQGVSEGGG